MQREEASPMVERGLIQVRFELHEELPRVRALMKRYRNLPMSLADACLVRMTERRRPAAWWRSTAISPSTAAMIAGPSRC
jgi:hypothetical protein